PILDLRGLNKFMVKLKFRMLSLGTIIPSMDPGDWYAALDMKDAYFHIAIYSPHRRFLRFVVDQRHFQFAVLPFGLSMAPHVFTKCMAVVAAALRRQRIQVFPYLDDWLIRGNSSSQVQSHILTALSMLNQLGLLLNVEKSTLEPTQRLDFIGAVLDSTLARGFLPEAYFQALVTIIRGLQSFPTSTACSCLSLLGHMASCTFVTTHARLRLRPLQAWLSSVYRPRRDSLDLVLTVPPQVLASLNWWLDPKKVLEGVLFHPSQPSLALTTDASSLGW
ncbi:ORF V, partial [Chelydra serpentina]